MKVLICLFGLVLSASLVIGCQPGWKQHGANCFLFSHNQGTWAEAEVICRAFDSYLAEPVDKATDDFIIGETLKTGRKYWLGLTDLEQEGRFVWISTHRELQGYTNWIPSDPNNAGAGEDCVLNNWNRDGKWADADCEWKEYYICQSENFDAVIG